MGDLISTADSEAMEKTVGKYLFTSKSKLGPEQKELFLQIALRNNLDPFKREIFAISYGNEFSIVTGYEVYIQRAEATGQLDGWNCVNTEEGAKLTIHRKDWSEPFEWEALYDEFDKGQSSWKKMKKFMIKKVCIGQGFRLAFPEVLGGLPHFREEVVDQGIGDKLPVQKTKSKSEMESLPEPEEDPRPDEPFPPEEDPSDVVYTRIEKVTKKGGKKKNGQPFTQCFIHSVGGTIYKTFDTADAQIAQDAVDAEAECKIRFEYNEQYKSHELVEIEPA